jgi:hypothetical protein
MTKVEIRIRLARPLHPGLMPRLSDLHAIYGIRAVHVAPDRETLAIEYDATRLYPADVEMALKRVGIPVAPTLA